MSDERSTPPLKSAYELALERLEADGIDRPDRDALTEADREAVAELRRKAEADLAQLEILHHKALAGTLDPAERARAEEEYRIDRQRIEERRDREIARVRAADCSPTGDQS